MVVGTRCMFCEKCYSINKCEHFPNGVPREVEYGDDECDFFEKRKVPSYDDEPVVTTGR